MVVQVIRRLFSWWGAFAVILGVAAILRLVNLDLDEVRTDEGNYAVRGIGWNDFMFSTELGTPWVWYQERDAVPAWSVLSFNDHPPLHFAGIWLSTRLLGIHLWAVRLPSVIYGVASVALVMLVLRRWGMSRGSLAAGALLAALPWHIFISRQAIQESGVIFWMLATVRLSQVVSERTTARPQTAWRWWAALGAVIGAGLLTKYSAALTLPVIGFIAWRERWLRRRGWWALPVALVLISSPVMIYNAQVYRARGHFDLQLARFLRQDTAKDWPASHQALWQGDVRQAWQFAKNHARGFSLPASAVAIAALPLLGRRRREIPPASWVWSFGAALLGGAIALVTLNDLGRGSILLPFYALTFGVAIQFWRASVARAVMPVVIAVLLLADVPGLQGRALDRLVQTFPARPVGFAAWETWRQNAIPTRLRPQHYRSLVDWWEHQYQILAVAPERTVVYDNRISWFPSNWYFFRYGFYARDAAFMNSGIFAYLAQNNALQELHGQTFRYVEVGPAARDNISQLDPQSAATHEFIRQLATRQTVTPELIRDHRGDVLFRIWQIRWDPAVTFPAPPTTLRDRQSRRLTATSSGSVNSTLESRGVDFKIPAVIDRMDGRVP